MTDREAMTNTAPQKTSVGAAVVALIVDAALVLLFAGLGRGSHARAATVAGLFETAWPFLVALALGWVVCLAWRRPLSLVRSGIPIWIITVGLGMVIRALSGGGTAVAFILVATGTLGVFLLGWRGIALLVLRLRRPARG